MIYIVGDFLDEVERLKDLVSTRYPSGGGNFVIPTANEMDQLLKLGIAMANKDFELAQQIIDSNNFPFEIVRWTDTGNNNAVYYMLREKDTGHKGWGTYVWADNPTKPWVIECPHPLNDAGTEEITARVFRAGAYSWAMAGAHRNNLAPVNEAYVSDPPDVDYTPFQAMHLANTRHHLVTLQLHGFSSSAPGRENYPGAICSEGHRSPSYRVKIFADELNKIGTPTNFTVGLYDGTQWMDLGAETNRQGVWSNALMSEPGHFVHLEMGTAHRLTYPAQTADYIIQAASKAWPDMKCMLHRLPETVPASQTSRTRPISARFVDGDPTTLIVYFSSPLSNVGDVNNWESDLTITSATLQDSGYSVKFKVSGTTKGVNHYIKAKNNVYDVWGNLVRDEKVYVEGITTNEIFSGEDLPAAQSHRNAPTFPISSTWDSINVSGINIVRTGTFNASLGVQRDGSSIMFRKRDDGYYSTYLVKNIPSTTTVWFRAYIYIPENYVQTGNYVYLARISPSSSQTSQGIRLMIGRDSSTGVLYWQISDGTTYTGKLAGREVKLGEWQLIEVRARAAVSNGSQELWMNGVKLASFISNTSSIAGWTYIQVGVNYQSMTSDTFDIFMDGVKISSTNQFGRTVPQNRIGTPVLSTSDTDNDKVTVWVPYHYNGNNVAIRARLYVNGKLDQTVVSSYVPHGKGKVTLNLPKSSLPGSEIYLDAFDSNNNYSQASYWYYRKDEFVPVEQPPEDNKDNQHEQPPQNNQPEPPEDNQPVQPDQPEQPNQPQNNQPEGFWNISVAELKKPIKVPDIMLAKPDRTVIAKLKNVVVNNYEINLGKLNKIDFETPAYINKYGEFRFNRYLDKLYEKYLLKVTLNGISEWMVISEIHEIDDQNEKVSVTAFSLPHELSFRTIRNYNVVSYNLTQIMNDLLQDTLWILGEVDPYFNTIYRSPQLEGSVLDCIFKIAETFDAIIEWDTENRKINFKRPENVGQNRGLKFKLGKYLKSISRDRLADEAFTRIIPYGRDGLQIHRVNPTGQPYIEDFTYYMLPFERDENRNVIQSSRYMSDELCHAILDYNDFVASKEGEFSSLLDQKEALEEQKMVKETELIQLNEDLKKIEDRLAVQRQTEALTIIDTTYDGWSKTYQIELKKDNYYAVMIKVSATDNLTIQLDDAVKNVTANTWNVIGKIHDKEITKVSLSGSATNVSVKIYAVEITPEEHDQTDNESAIIEKYNEDNKQAQIDAKQAEINAIESQINNVDNAIENLRNELALENHFTPELLKERQAYIFQTEFVDENYTNDRELYEAAKNKLAEIAFPKTNVTIDIVNLFDVVDPKVQRDWDKLTLGDYVNIEHETLKINYEAQIIGISFDFENGEIKLTIGSLRNKNDNGSPIDKLKNLYKNAVTSSTIITNNKSKWSKIDAHETAINKILSEPWDATKQAIIAGSNESVLIDNKGIRITDPNNPKEYLIANHAVIALTDDGGQTWKHAITTKGIVGERIYGGIFIGANLYMENESGLFRFDKDGAIFDSTAIKLATSHKGIDFDPENVIKEVPVNTWASNDSISAVPADPVVLPDNQAINHTVNKDGTVNISFEWKYDGDGSDKYDIDGFIVYLYASSSSAEYEFGTDVVNEYNFVVSDSKKALILYNLPADLYYTFGVQAYRIVDTSINKSGILKSAIVKSNIDIENPYCPASRTPYDGDIRGTLTTNDMTQIVSKTVQLGYVYNGVQIDTNSGLVVTRSDNNFRSIFNATDGIKLQAKVNDNWEDRFYVDFEGTLRARKLILENENGDIILDGKNGTLDFGKFNAIFGTIKAENIEAKSITADQIKDNSITSDNLHTLAKDLINNFTKTLDINTGWSIIAGQGTVTAGTSVAKNNTREVILETSSDATYASDYIPVDPSKTYKTTISLYCDDSVGTRYFGVYAYDANKTLIAVTEWNVSSHSWGSTTTTPYFWYGDGVIADADGNLIYRDMEAYILSSNINDDGVPTGRNVDKHFKLPPEARYIRIFVANNNNNGTNTQVNIWSPTVIASDTGIFSFSQLQGGQIKLGGANGVSGSLIIANENNENFVEMSSNGVFISKLIVNDIDCDAVLTVENEDKTFYVDPINGHDENDGLTTLTPLKSIQRAVNLTRRSNDGTTKIILLGNNYTFTEFVDMGGYTGKGDIILTFPSDQSVTMYGTLRVVNSGVFIQIENAVISWTENPNPDLALVSPLYIERSRGVFVKNCKLFAQNMTQYGVYLSWGSFARFTSCEISGGLQSSIVLENSNAFVENCTGTSFEGIRVKGASVLAGVGTAPKGSSGSHVVTDLGGICNAQFTYTDGTSTPPAQTTSTTREWSTVASASWRNKYGGWRNDNNYVYQGEYGHNGVHKGFWFLPSDLLDTIQGKTITRMQFKPKRRAEGGKAGYVNIYFYYHTYQDENTARNSSNPSVYGPVQIFQFKWGDDKWIELPSSWFSAFSNGTAKGVAIYVSNSSDYAIFEGSARIRITYQ